MAMAREQRTAARPATTPRTTTHVGGKRVAPKPSSGHGGKIALAVVGTLATAALAGYLVLCSRAASDTLWPGTSMMGIDLGGLTYEESARKLKQELPAKLAEKNVELYEPSSGARVSLEAEGLLETETLVDDLWASRDLGDFFTRGARYLDSLVTGNGGMDIPAVLEITPEGEQRLDQALKEVAHKAGVTGNESSWVMNDSELVFTKGITSRTVDAEKARTDVKTALTKGNGGTVEVGTTLAPPSDVDIDAIHASIYTQPVNATLNVKTMDIIPGSNGVDFQVDEARAAFSAVGEGETCRVPLIITAPEITAAKLEALLFRDTLGSAVTTFSGTSDRLKSIKNAAGFVNGTILLPGEQFSYNKTCEPYTESNGYGKAGAYVNGHTVDTVAGGICQLSSTLYWATLKSNLKIAERHNHAYFPSYIPGGLDATVYGGGADYKFINDTEYPIKIETYVDSSKYVHAVIYGTNLTGIHGEPYSTNKVITQRATTVYEADSSVPRGTTRRDTTRTAYDGATIEAYQKLVDAKGNTVSETLLHKDTYKCRNAVVLYNPADGAPGSGGGGGGGSSTPKPVESTPKPTESVPEPTEYIPIVVLPTPEPEFNPIQLPSYMQPEYVPEPVYTPAPIYVPEPVYTPESVYIPTPVPVYIPETIYAPEIIPTVPEVPISPIELPALPPQY